MTFIYFRHQLNEGESETVKLPKLEDGLTYRPKVFVKTFPIIEGDGATLMGMIEREAKERNYAAVFVSRMYVENANVVENLSGVERNRAVCVGYKVTALPEKLS